MIDPEPRRTHCDVCGTALRDTTGKRGRPARRCGDRCAAVAQLAQRRKRCKLCRCPTLFMDERLCGVCRPCRDRLAEVRQ